MNDLKDKINIPKDKRNDSSRSNKDKIDESNISSTCRFTRDQLYDYLKSSTNKTQKQNTTSILKENYFEAFTSDSWPVENIKLFNEFNLSDCLEKEEVFSINSFNIEFTRKANSSLNTNSNMNVNLHNMKGVEYCMNCSKQGTGNIPTGNTGQTRKFIDNSDLVTYTNEFKNFQKLLLIGNSTKFLYVLLPQYKNNSSGNKLNSANLNLSDDSLLLLNNISNNVMIGPFNSSEVIKMISDKVILSNTLVKLVDCFNYIGSKDSSFPFREFAEPEKLVMKLTINQLANNLQAVQNQLNPNKENKQNIQKVSNKGKDNNKNSTKVKSNKVDQENEQVKDKMNISKQNDFDENERIVLPEQEVLSIKDRSNKNNKVKEMNKNEDHKNTTNSSRNDDMEFSRKDTGNDRKVRDDRNQNKNTQVQENATIKKKKKKMTNIDITTGFFTMSEEESRYTQHFTIK